MSQMLFDQRNAATGQAIAIDNVTNIGYIQQTLTTTLSGTASYTPDLSKAGVHFINLSTNGTFTINNPINLPVPLAAGLTNVGAQFTLVLSNTSGGVIAAAVTFGGQYRTGSYANPANGKVRIANLIWNGTSWFCENGFSADV